MLTRSSAVFSSTHNFIERLTLPSGTTGSEVVGILHDHEFILRCDPQLKELREIPPTDLPSLPKHVRKKQVAEPRKYSLLDSVPNVPSSLCRVESTTDFTDLEAGVYVRLRSPLSVVMETEWKVKEGDTGGLEIFRESTISCSSFLMPVAKPMFCDNLIDFGKKIVERLDQKQVNDILV